MYEYRWMNDCIHHWLGRDHSAQTIMDVGCGSNRPGCLMLAASGFGRVDAFDRFVTHPLLAQLAVANLRYVQGDVLCELPGSYDCVLCLSLLHQLPTLTHQLHALKNLSHAVNPGGALILTVQTPGSTPEVYEQYLRDHTFDLITTDIPETQRLSLPNDPTRSNREIRYLYRLFATRAY